MFKVLAPRNSTCLGGPTWPQAPGSCATIAWGRRCHEACHQNATLKSTSTYIFQGGGDCRSDEFSGPMIRERHAVESTPSHPSKQQFTIQLDLSGDSNSKRTVNRRSSSNLWGIDTSAQHVTLLCTSTELCSRPYIQVRLSYKNGARRQGCRDQVLSSGFPCNTHGRVASESGRLVLERPLSSNQPSLWPPRRW